MNKVQAHVEPCQWDATLMAVHISGGRFPEVIAYCSRIDIAETIATAWNTGRFAEDHSLRQPVEDHSKEEH